ncbi:MAG TPA: Minf_1886 family protein [Gemmatimonadales bacterium]|nr:Minf_1886 family protein [Gemmatimonadales bacterium]
MYQLQLADEIVERIREREVRYDPQAYLFLLGALEFSQERRPVRGHIGGEELAWACRDFALEQFGLTAHTVLRHWGVDSTTDLGRIVFTLVDIGLLVSQPQDRIEDFADVYQFGEAFDAEYPWRGIDHIGGT